MAMAAGPDRAREATQPRVLTQTRNLRQAAVRAGAYVVLFGVLTTFAVMAPAFATAANLGNVLGQSAILGVLAVGLTVVVIGGGPNVVAGGIDLSLAATMGLSAAVYATVIGGGSSDVPAAGAALATGLAVGLVNAVAVVGFGIVPLLATLAVMNIVAGLELVLTENTAVPVTTDALAALAGNGPFQLPVLSLVLLGVAGVVALAVQGTPTGLRLYAAGDFPDAARAAGLPVRRLVAGTYVVSGLCGGLAGILSVAYLSGSTTGSGDMLLSVVATALLGVMFSRRLLPTIGGTLLSTVFIGALTNGFQLLNLSSYWVSGIEGVLILAAVGATSLRPRREG